MNVWVNWGLVAGAIPAIFGDLVPEVYDSVNLPVLGMFLPAGGVLGLAINSARVGLGSSVVLAVLNLIIFRCPGHMQPKHVTGR